MIVVNEKFSISRDKYQWLLHELKEGIHPMTRKLVESTHTTYHPSVRFCCNEIAQRMAGECTSVKEIVEAMDSLERTLDRLFPDSRKSNK